VIELYESPDTPCCMKVRMVLAEKRLDWTLRPILTSKFDHYQPEYQKLNPLNLIPTLVDDGVAYIQSGVIAEYLDDKYPDPPLRPSDPRTLAKVREWMREEEEFLFRLITTMSYNIMMKLRAKGYGMAQLVEWAKRHPNQERAQDYLYRVTCPADMKAVAEAEKKFRWHMERLEEQLAASGGPWIVGAQFTLADVCVAPIFDRIEYLDKEYLWQGLPRVEAWYARVKMRPSFKAAAPSFEDRMWGPKKPVMNPVMA
jgi:glutathione S-transferase